MEYLPISEDFKELLSLFADEKVRYLIIGGYAVTHYGYPRYTKDLDLWIDRTDDNAKRVFRALSRFGAPVQGMSEADFKEAGSVFLFGVEPLRVDILNDIDGVQFDEAWGRKQSTLYGGVPVNVIARDDLIANKRATGRLRDRQDVETLLDFEKTDP
jgi:hypothetical protein